MRLVFQNLDWLFEAIILREDWQTMFFLAGSETCFGYFRGSFPLPHLFTKTWVLRSTKVAQRCTTLCHNSRTTQQKGPYKRSINKLVKQTRLEVVDNYFTLFLWPVLPGKKVWFLPSITLTKRSFSILFQGGQFRGIKFSVPNILEQRLCEGRCIVALRRLAWLARRCGHTKPRCNGGKVVLD